MIKIVIQADKQTYSQASEQTNRQTDRQACTKASRQARMQTGIGAVLQADSPARMQAGRHRRRLAGLEASYSMHKGSNRGRLADKKDRKT